MMRKYVKRLEDKSKSVSDENDHLKREHKRIKELMVGLFEVDLLKQRFEWDIKLRKIKWAIYNNSKERDPEDCKEWKKHWNFQIFKVLDYQYKKSLNFLSRSLPEMNVQLLLKDQNIQIKPDFFIIKEQVYNKINEFVNYPSKFKAIGGNPQIFYALPEKNAKYLSKLYLEAEILFNKLRESLKNFSEWGAVTQLNASVIVDECCANID